MNTEIKLDVQGYMQQLGKHARQAARVLAAADTNQKALALQAMATAIRDSAETIKQQNSLDMQAGRQSGLSDALLDRLELTDARIESMASGLEQIAQLPDPVGEVTDMKYRPSGLQIGKMRVPLGVVGIIYESRPNVTADAAAICLKECRYFTGWIGSAAFKSGNCQLYSSGAESCRSAGAIGSGSRYY